MGECVKQIKAESRAESSAIRYSSAIPAVAIEQVGPLKANKKKWLEMDSEAVSAAHSRTAEKREMEEQRRQMARAYKFQMGECAIKQIQAESSAIHYIPAVIGTMLIEQIGTPKANKMKGRAMLKAYRLQMEKCAKLI